MVEGHGSELFAAVKTSEERDVFPPCNHENLHLLPPPVSSLSTQSSSSASSFSYFSPSSSSSASSSYSDADEEECHEPCHPKPPVQVNVSGRYRPEWLRIGIGLIRLKVLGEARSIVESGGGRWGRVFWSIGTLAAFAAWVRWLYVRIRFRRRWMRLVEGTRKRDEKIAQLLHQIAQMKEVLLLKPKELASRLPN